MLLMVASIVVKLHLLTSFNYSLHDVGPMDRQTEGGMDY